MARWLTTGVNLLEVGESKIGHKFWEELIAYFL
jgi:hypothetical protein